MTSSEKYAKASGAGRKKGNTYLMHTNETMAIGLFKECILKILLEPEEKKHIKERNKLQEEMERYVLPIRKQSHALTEKAANHIKLTTMQNWNR